MFWAKKSVTHFMYSWDLFKPLWIRNTPRSCYPNVLKSCMMPGGYQSSLQIRITISQALQWIITMDEHKRFKEASGTLSVIQAEGCVPIFVTHTIVLLVLTQLYNAQCIPECEQTFHILFCQGSGTTVIPYPVGSLYRCSSSGQFTHVENLNICVNTNLN